MFNIVHDENSRTILVVCVNFNNVVASDLE